MAGSLALPTTLPAAAAMPATVKAALPALTVMLVNGAMDILFAVLILAAGWTVARWTGRWLRDLLARSQMVDETLKPLIANFTRYAILAITFVAVLGQFGVQTTSLIALLGAAGLAIGLALQGTLSNVASGVMLLLLRPFRVADTIRIGEIGGTVREIGLFRTEIVTGDGTFVSIPNATIFAGTIVNISRESIRRTNFTIEVDRAENLDTVQRTLLECLKGEARVMQTPAPTVEIENLGALSTTLSVMVWMENRDYPAALSDVKKRVRHTLQASEIAAPVPVRAPSVAPWTPDVEPMKQPAAAQGKKPN